MAVKSDIEIAQSAKMRPIEEIGEKLGIPAASLIPYGRDKAKISSDFIRQNGHQADGKLILVTAVSPTPAGEGKTTTTVGLGDALNLIGKQAVICLQSRAMFWHEGRCGRWRLRSGCADD
jgi:formate--tetrahydrofolate ligase